MRWGDHLRPPGLDSRSCWKSQPEYQAAEAMTRTMRCGTWAYERVVGDGLGIPCLAVKAWIKESTQMKMIAVRVGLWFRAALKGPTDTEMRSLWWRETSRQTVRHDRRDDREIIVPQQTRNTAVEGSGVRKTVGCMSVGSTEAVQSKQTRKWRERGRRADDEPTNPLDKQPDTPPLSWPTNVTATCTEWTPPRKSKEECHTQHRTPQYTTNYEHISYQSNS